MTKQSEYRDKHGNLIEGSDHVLHFVLMILHGGFHHKKWLIKAAINYIEGKDLHDNNEDTPACP